MYLGRAYAQKKMFADAIEEFQKADDLSGGEPYFRAWLGYGYAVSGQAGKARKVLNQLKNLRNSNYVPPYDVAAIWVGLGQKDQALKWLQRAYEDHATYYPAINVEPVFDPLHSDQRSQDLVRRIASRGNDWAQSKPAQGDRIIWRATSASRQQYNGHG